MKFSSQNIKRLLILGSLPFLITSMGVYAQSEAALDNAYDNGYDDGYDDAYDDCMEDCECPRIRFMPGFYVGAGGGYEGFQTVRKPFIDNDYIGTFNNHANGWNGRLFGGYGNFYKYYYMGLEGFVGTSSASGMDFVNTFGTDYRGKISAKTSYGLSALPGIRIGETGPLVFTRLGVVKTQFELSDSVPGLSTKSTHWASGFNAGLGIEYPLFNKVVGRFEYDYVKYSSFNEGGNVGAINAPTDNFGMLGVRYTF